MSLILTMTVFYFESKLNPNKYMIRKRTGDPWIDHGIGYVRFAMKEKHLFRGLMAAQIAAVRASEIFLPEDERVFTDPYAEYFLTTRTWDTVHKKIYRSKNIWGEENQ